MLDTWFSSGLWPFATLGWPEDTPELRAFYPTDVLSTARDILFLWVARMVMLGLRFTGDVPFTDVYIHSVIQAPDGRRMSKSLGTGIDPLDLIEGAAAGLPRAAIPAYGADAVRFGLMAMASTQDVRFSEEKVAQGAQLTNKLFNASRLILMNAPEGVEPRRAADDGRGPLDPLAPAAAPRPRRPSASTAFDFSKLSLGLYDFVFSELCDWYLELVKPRLYDGDEDAQATVLHVLRETLALAHPVIPFVTEDIWSLRWDGLLAARAMPAGRRGARSTPRPRRRSTSRSTAIRTLRNWRESVGVAPRIVVRGSLDSDAPRRSRRSSRRMARFEWTSNGDEPAATVPVAGRRRRRVRDRGPGPRRGRAQARGRARAPGGRDRARPRSSPTRGSSPRRRPRSSRRSAAKLERLRAELEAL